MTCACGAPAQHRRVLGQAGPAECCRACCDRALRENVGRPLTYEPIPTPAEEALDELLREVDALDRAYERYEGRFGAVESVIAAGRRVRETRRAG